MKPNITINIGCLVKVVVVINSDNTEEMEMQVVEKITKALNRALGACSDRLDQDSEIPE